MSMGENGDIYFATARPPKLFRLDMNQVLHDIPLDGPTSPKSVCYIKGTVFFVDNNAIWRVPSDSSGPSSRWIGPQFELDSTPDTFGSLFGICADPRGHLLVCDNARNRILRISPSGCVSSLLCDVAVDPIDVCVGPHGEIFFTDHQNHRIHRLLPTGTTEVLAGSTEGTRTGPALSSLFSYPCGVCLDLRGNLVVTEYTSGNLREIQGGEVMDIARETYTKDLSYVAVDYQGDYIICDAEQVRKRASGLSLEHYWPEHHHCLVGNQVEMVVTVWMSLVMSGRIPNDVGYYLANILLTLARFKNY
eukprot:TRINITY_DN14411_c0_g2_i1.p1 TRINITY_DN14411_c0_g2~~TRINITY_DN14411_c0_g2_i1.p1  ORF type:complete len:318 (-),score=35.93 TRINITY_DN14411_c0_g2_i1:180-1094(-)